MKGKHLPLIFTFPSALLRSHIAQHAYTAASIRALPPLDLSARDVLQFIPSPIESEMNARGFVGYRIQEILQNDRVTMTNRWRSPERPRADFDAILRAIERYIDSYVRVSGLPRVGIINFFRAKRARERACI